MNGVGIGMAAVIIAAAQATIRLVLRAGRSVCHGAVSGMAMPFSAG